MLFVKLNWLILSKISFLLNQHHWESGHFHFRKDTLVRKFETIQTIYGDVTVKRSFYNGKEVSCKPEYEECKRIATEKGIPVKVVYNNIMALLTNKVT